MNKKQSFAIIDAAFSRIDGPQDGFSTVRDILYRICLASEKDHRRSMGRRRCGLTTGQAARLFTVQCIAQGLAKPDRWDIDDVICVRLEYLKAQAYVKRHRADFLAGFEDAGVTLADVLAVDYVELME